MAERPPATLCHGTASMLGMRTGLRQATGQLAMQTAQMAQVPLRCELAQLVGQGAAGQPLPACWQHHTFLSMDQLACQCAKAASQSYGGKAVVAHPRTAEGQPLPVLRQHHAFFAGDQLATHLS